MGEIGVVATLTGLDMIKRAQPISPRMRFLLFCVVSALCFGEAPEAAYAYIGPGAGFAVISSFFTLFFAGIVALFALLLWPFRTLVLYLKRRKTLKNRKAGRVIVVGLDGLDPCLAAGYMKRGRLPNFMRLKEMGSFRPLRTTLPSISPVAWSTFATGVNPGKHRVFDFYTRNPSDYSAVLSSVDMGSHARRWGIGKVSISFRRPTFRFLRKSTSLWKILGQCGVFCSILRVPITFPPEKFHGLCLSSFCTPDLRGTQGSFTCLTTEKGAGTGTAGLESMFVPIDMRGTRFKSSIPGPVLMKNGRKRTLAQPLEGEVDKDQRRIKLRVNGERFYLKQGLYSPWVKLQFKAGFRRAIPGIARFLVTEVEPELKIYVTPINVDPEKPAFPFTHPFSYGPYLSKMHGPFSTLGLAEDTWALNERVIDEGAFLQQAYDIFEERKRILLEEMKKNKNGLIAAVFDTSDRIQHMFFRYFDRNHPANEGKDTLRHKNAIEELYQKADLLVGELLSKLREGDVLMIISDHGFKPFKWGVNLNTWLYKEGYLVLKEGAEPGGEWFANVDWPRTRAFSMGLTGIFLNIRGRERDGTVEPGKDRVALQIEIKNKLEALVDDRNGTRPIRRCFLAQEVLRGPYKDEAPDLMIGYRTGYRVSWNSAVGKITDEVIEENTRSWSGDHSIDPILVPGIFFSNWKLAERTPALVDVAPTILSLFGAEPQSFHDGKALTLKPS
jgi:predicted AlkP superfamily phosphohydrolase/phosphomutase